MGKEGCCALHPLSISPAVYCRGHCLPGLQNHLRPSCRRELGIAGDGREDRDQRFNSGHIKFEMPVRTEPKCCC